MHLDLVVPQPVGLVEHHGAVRAQELPHEVAVVLGHVLGQAGLAHKGAAAVLAGQGVVHRLHVGDQGVPGGPGAAGEGRVEAFAAQMAHLCMKEKFERRLTSIEFIPSTSFKSRH